MKTQTRQWGPADKDYGLDGEGKVCEATDLKVRSMLVAEGQMLSIELAVRYGLMDADPLLDVEPGLDAAPASKGTTSTAAPKSRGRADLRTADKTRAAGAAKHTAAKGAAKK